MSALSYSLYRIYAVNFVKLTATNSCSTAESFILIWSPKFDNFSLCSSGSTVKWSSHVLFFEGWEFTHKIVPNTKILLENGYTKIFLENGYTVDPHLFTVPDSRTHLFADCFYGMYIHICRNSPIRCIFHREIFTI